MPRNHSSKDIGIYGERIAEKFLKRQEYEILVRNYESDHGEIDLVCRHQKTLVFVEVKARGESSIERPARAVGEKKQKKIIRTAYTYLSEISERDMPLRFDIVEVYLSSRQKPRCELIQSAFEIPRRDKWH